MNIAKDLQYALRTFVKQPLFTCVAVVTLALGIGANASIFSVIHGVLLQPLPLPQAEQLMRIQARSGRGFDISVSIPNYFSWEEMASSFETMGAARFTSINLTGTEQPARLQAQQVLGDFFGALGVSQGFADLVPEHSWSVSAGIDFAPSSVLSVGLEGFSNWIDDLIETAFVGNTQSGLLIYSPRNVARARTRGIEASGTLRVGEADVEADYAFLDARTLEEDLPLDRRARHSGRVRVGSPLPGFAAVRLDLTGHVTGDAPLIGVDDAGDLARIGTQERLAAVDVSISAQLPGALRLTSGIDNLFDARPEGWQAVIGRRFRIGLQAIDLF